MAPQVNPAPKAALSTWSPGLIRPSSRASSIAIGTVADDPEAARAHWDGRGSLVVQTWIDQVPNPDSRVTLDEARDALGIRRARTLLATHAELIAEIVRDLDHANRLAGLFRSSASRSE